MTITERIKTLESALNGTPKPSKERTEYIQALLSDLQKQVFHDANVIHPERIKTTEHLPAWANRYEFEERAGMIEQAGYSPDEATRRALTELTAIRENDLATLPELDRAIIEIFNAEPF